MNPRTCVGWVALASLISGLLLSTANLYWGELNQDEGWYLYAARLTAQGAQPYHDFAFTQGPVFAHVYALTNGWVERSGLWAGRVFTAFLGLLALLLATATAWRLAPEERRAHAAAITFTLLACNVYHSYFSLVVKTYSLCALLIAGACFALTFARNPRASVWPCAIAGLLLALSAGVRLSAGILLPVLGLFLLYRRAHFGSAWIAFGAGGLVGLLLAFAPAFWTNPEAAWFWLVEFHTVRATGPLSESLIYKAGFISRFVQFYFVLCAGILILLALHFFAKTERPSHFSLVPGLWLAGIALSLVHLAAPFPYEDYQVVIVPLFAALLGIGVANRLHSLPNQQAFGVVLVVYVLSIGAACSSPLNQNWALLERDRIWWPLKKQSDLGKLRSVARGLQAYTQPGDLLLTQDLYVAVEARLTVPQGLEMGPFSYFPDWPREKAERRRVLNRDMMMELLATTSAKRAAFSGYGLAIRSPSITELTQTEQTELYDIIQQRYEPVKEILHFGQAHTNLRIYRLKPEP